MNVEYKDNIKCLTAERRGSLLRARVIAARADGEGGNFHLTNEPVPFKIYNRGVTPPFRTGPRVILINFSRFLTSDTVENYYYTS